jgi:predicted metal-dependent membrane protease
MFKGNLSTTNCGWKLKKHCRFLLFDSIGAWIIYSGMGVVLATIYRTTKKLEYGIMAHVINNALAVSMMLHL